LEVNVFDALTRRGPLVVLALGGLIGGLGYMGYGYYVSGSGHLWALRTGSFLIAAVPLSLMVVYVAGAWIAVIPRYGHSGPRHIPSLLAIASASLIWTIGQLFVGFSSLGHGSNSLENAGELSIAVGTAIVAVTLAACGVLRAAQGRDRYSGSSVGPFLIGSFGFLSATAAAILETTWVTGVNEVTAYEMSAALWFALLAVALLLTAVRLLGPSGYLGNLAAGLGITAIGFVLVGTSIVRGVADNRTLFISGYVTAGGGLVVAALVAAVGAIALPGDSLAGVLTSRDTAPENKPTGPGEFVSTPHELPTEDVSTIRSRYCTQCGESLPRHARFCGSCGQPVHIQSV